MPEGKSPAETLASLTDAERREFLGSLTRDQKLRLIYRWDFWARPKQRLPPGHWFVWGCLAGRGFGKTRTAAESVRELVDSGKYKRVALVGPTAADVRDVMVEGESGLLSVFPHAQRPLYEPSKRRITFRNGAIATTFSAEEPERLRGPQHDLAWLDEPAAYPHLDKLWSLLVPGLRLGAEPRAILTTTPRPLPFFHTLLDQESTVLTSGSTFENSANLAKPTLDYLKETLLGTDLGQQELEGQLLGENPGALWKKAWIDSARVDRHPAFKRVVVAIDPSSSAKEEACECGIVVAGLGEDDRGYVLEDLSKRTTPADWVRIALDARERWVASQIIYEGNHGAGFILEIFRMVDPDSLQYLKGVQATTDKERRALPVAALTQKGKVRFVGTHIKLEQQLTSWIPKVGKSPDRLDAMVWAMTELLVQYREPPKLSTLNRLQSLLPGYSL
ncbi:MULTISPECIES: terminase large subunit domain-containing protein [Sorangium]|nr:MULTISPECIES: terminase family protein [Sorangium]